MLHVVFESPIWVVSWAHVASPKEAVDDHKVDPDNKVGLCGSGGRCYDNLDCSAE